MSGACASHTTPAPPDQANRVLARGHVDAIATVVSVAHSQYHRGHVALHRALAHLAFRLDPVIPRARLDRDAERPRDPGQARDKVGCSTQDLDRAASRRDRGLGRTGKPRASRRERDPPVQSGVSKYLRPHDQQARIELRTQADKLLGFEDLVNELMGATGGLKVPREDIVEALTDNPPEHWGTTVERQVDKLLGDRLAEQAKVIVKRAVNGGK